MSNDQSNSNLHKIKYLANEGFKVPSDYFDTLEDNVIRKSNAGILKHQEFKIPNGYFEDFDKRIL